MIFLENLNLKIHTIDGYKLRGKSFYKSIVDYRIKILKKLKHKILKSESKKICILCNSEIENKILDWEEGYALHKCNNCKAISANIEISSSDNHTHTIYENDLYNEKFYRDIHKQFNYRREVFGKTRHEYIAKFFGVKENINLLDLGCGAGYFLSYIKDKNVTAKGLEVSKYLVNYCKKYWKLNVASTKIEDEPNNFYDVITMFDVIEHIDKPIETFVLINKKLKSGGICVAYTPNLNSFAYELMGSKQNTLLPFEHLCFYSESAFKYLANSTSFKIESIETYGLDLLDYFLYKEYEYSESYLNKFSDLISLTQAILDKNSLSNHFRVVFRKI